MNTKHFNFAENRLLGNLEDLAALHTCNAQFDIFKPIFCFIWQGQDSKTTIQIVDAICQLEY